MSRPQPLPKVSSKYGSPMGRAGDNPDSDYTGLVYLEPILDPCPNACGAYDYGGAYWGTGGNVWRCVASEEFDGAESHWETFFRGPSSLDSDDRIEAAARESGWDSARFEILEPLGGCKADDGEPCDWCYECEAEESARALAGQVSACDLDALKNDLQADGYTFESLDSDGDLRIRQGDSTRVERWQLRAEGEGCNNSYWAPDDFPGGFEFCGSDESPRDSGDKWALYFYRALTDDECEAGGYDDDPPAVWQETTAADLRTAIDIINADGAADGYDACTCIESSSGPSGPGDWVTVYYQSSRTVSLHRRESSGRFPTAASVRRVLKLLQHHCG